MRTALPWLMWPALLAFTAGAVMSYKEQNNANQVAIMCGIAMLGIFGDILLFYTFLGNGECFLFRRRTVRIYGETLCRVAEGTLGTLIVLGSLFFLGAGAVIFPQHMSKFPGSEMVPVISAAGLLLILLFAVLIAVAAFTGSGRPAPSPPPADPAGREGEEPFNF